MRLSDFILSNMEPILAEWEVFARSVAPGAKMDHLALRDHAQAILAATTQDMHSDQSDAQSSAKSKGLGHDDREDAPLNTASELHGVGRLESGFDLRQVVSEYRALRASVLKLWRDSNPAPHERDLNDLTRFNESIDQSLARAVAAYTQKVDQSRDLFLAILSHDLRNPLNSIAVSAHAIPHLTELDPESAEMVDQIATGVSVMGRMINDLLDYTRTRLGTGMPVDPAPMDASHLCRELFEEYRAANPKRTFHFSSAGDVTGQWDVDRLRQAVSNLLGNAVQHGDPELPVDLKVVGDDAEVAIVVHSGGPAILPGDLERIFAPLFRGTSAQHRGTRRPGSIGLGLYIARAVVNSHGGRIDVTSTQSDGTAFTIRLPRTAAAVGNQITSA